MLSVLITGFGPFPGAPFNPTGALVRRLMRIRRPRLHDVHRAAHVFRTRYAAVDRELPELIARHRPDVVLMFGLAARTAHVRIETRARNIVAAFPDAAGSVRRSAAIASGAPFRPLRSPSQALLAAARASCVPVALSRDAGNYLCNYLYWRALEAGDQRNGPRVIVFIHVPAIAHGARPASGRKRRIAMDDLVRVGGTMMMTLLAAARR